MRHEIVVVEHGAIAVPSMRSLHRECLSETHRSCSRQTRSSQLRRHSHYISTPNRTTPAELIHGSRLSPLACSPNETAQLMPATMMMPPVMASPGPRRCEWPPDGC